MKPTVEFTIQEQAVIASLIGRKAIACLDNFDALQDFLYEVLTTKDYRRIQAETTEGGEVKLDLLCLLRLDSGQMLAVFSVWYGMTFAILPDASALPWQAFANPSVIANVRGSQTGLSQEFLTLEIETAADPENPIQIGYDMTGNTGEFVEIPDALKT